MTYHFKQIDNQVVTVTQYNTRITWVKPNGKVAVIPTLNSLAKYNFYQKTVSIRHYAGLLRLFSRYSVY